MTPERWTFTVEAVGPGAPAVCRVRRLLKHMWRTHRLRCVAVGEVPTDGTTGGAVPGNVAGGPAPEILGPSGKLDNSCGHRMPNDGLVNL